ncbi:MAG TPA: cupin domain-containing protein [Ideonella sp.]|nr:cupin domain-containing protein [Ideonella sp.]
MNTTSPPDFTDADPPLAADVQALITAGQAAGPLDARAGARVKSALLGRIARAQGGLLTVQRDTAAGDEAAATAGATPSATSSAEGPCWQPFLPGIRIKVLHEWQGVMSYLMHFAPGAVLPGHRHPHDEECVVLEGALEIGDELVVRAGGFHMARQGDLHAPIRSPEGAVIYLRGAVPEAAQLF